MQNKVKTLQEILRENENARSYLKELHERGQQRLAFEAQVVEVPACETCGGLGFVSTGAPLGHPLFGQTIACTNPTCGALAEQRNRRYEKLCTLAQIPEEYAELSLDIWRQLFELEPQFCNGKLPAYGAILAFIEARNHGFYFTLDDAAQVVGIEVPDFDAHRRCSIALTGDFGVGKTALAVCGMRELLDVYQMHVVYLLMGEFFQGLHERFEKKSEYEFGGDASDEAELIRTYQQAPILVIDEFPLKPGKSDWWEQQVYSLVNYRYVHHMPTIITTNFTPDELTESWGGMIGHRLHTMCHWIEVGGLDMRRRDKTWRTS